MKLGEGQMTLGQAAEPTEDRGDAMGTHVCLKSHLILKPWETVSATCSERLSNLARGHTASVACGI